jgi:hypothetical protein
MYLNDLKEKMQNRKMLSVAAGDEKTGVRGSCGYRYLTLQK